MPDERAVADQVAAFWDALILHQGTEEIDVEEDLAAALARFQVMGTASPGGASQRVWRRLQPALAHQADGEGLGPVTMLPPLPTIDAAPRLDTSPLPQPNHAPRALTYVATAALLLVTLLISAIALGNVRFGWHPVSAPLLGLQAPEPAPSLAPDPATIQGLLTEITVPALPPQAGYIDIERWNYPPMSDPATTSPLTGPMLVFVTSGQLAVSFDGGGGIVRGRDPVPSPTMLLPTGGEIRAGETLLVPTQARMTISNPAATAATSLVVQILSGTASDWVLPFDQAAIGQESLASGWGEFAPGPAQLTLDRTTLAPDESVPAPPSGAFQLVGAESKYLGYLTRSPDGAVTNREKEPLGVLIVTITQPSPA